MTPTALSPRVDVVAWLYQIAPGGAERLAHEIVNQRHRVYPGQTRLVDAQVLGYRQRVPFADYGHYPRHSQWIPLHPYIARGRYKARWLEPLFLKLLERWYRASDQLPDLAHGLGPNALAAAKVGLPIVSTIIGYKNYPYVQAAVQRSQAIICPAHKVQQQLVQAGFAKANFHVIHQGVNRQRFQAGEAQTACQHYALSPQRRYLVSIHNFQAKRRTEDIIFSFEMAHQQGSLPDDLDLVLCGRGPREQVIRQRISASRLADRIHLRISFDGPHLPDLYRLSHIFVAAGDTTPDDTQLPLAVLEAMSAGVPILAANVGALDEVLQHGQTGYLVAPGDAQALARGLHVLLKDDDLCCRLATQATEDSQRYSWATVVEQQEAIYRAILI